MQPAESVRARIGTARRIQQERLQIAGSPALVNAHADGKILETIAPLAEDARVLLNKAMEAVKLSARGYYRVLRVARTIADLDGAPDIVGKGHIAEALSYRRHVIN
jgi:magnesium chelatase family protein